MKFYSFKECLRKDFVCGWLKGDKFKENTRCIGWNNRVIKTKSENRYFKFGRRSSSCKMRICSDF